LLSSQAVADANALFRATEQGDIETVRALIDSGVDVNERNRFGSFALNSAAVKNNITLLHFFIEKGADVNVQNWSGDTA
jgi:ankyrin repeat protein